MTLFERGRRAFSSAVSPPSRRGANDRKHVVKATAGPAYAAVVSAMRGYTIPLGIGMSPSLWDIYRGLVFTMSICLVAMGALGLMIAASRDATARLLSSAALVLGGFSAALTLLYWVYRVPPPLITMAIVTALFAIAVVTTSRASRP